MALLFMDGFDAGDWNQKWTVASQGSLSTTTRFSAGRSLSLTGASHNVTKSFTATPEIFVGFAAMRSTLTSNYELLVIRGDNGATSHLSLFFSTTGALLLYRGGTQIAVSPIEKVAINTWAYLEMSATISDSTGHVVVRVDGITAIDYTGDTKNAGTSTNIDSVFIMGTAGSTFIDDLYICNNTGAAPYNSFLGDVRIATLTPNGIGTHTNFTPSSGDNYTTVDELPYSSADYVTATASGTRDTYTMSDLSGNYDVLAVQTNVIAKKLDAGGTAVKPVIVSGGTAYSGSGKVLSASDTVATDIRTVDPATSVAWTMSGVNSIEAGMEIA